MRRRRDKLPTPVDPFIANEGTQYSRLGSLRTPAPLDPPFYLLQAGARLSPQVEQLMDGVEDGHVGWLGSGTFRQLAVPLMKGLEGVLSPKCLSLWEELGGGASDSPFTHPLGMKGGDAKHPRWEPVCMPLSPALVRQQPNMFLDRVKKGGGYLKVELLPRFKQRMGHNEIVSESAHRLLLLCTFGPPRDWDEHPVCMHLCHQPHCLNPWHYAWGSDQDNTLAQGEKEDGLRGTMAKAAVARRARDHAYWCKQLGVGAS